ncbi:2,3,4,5-tetrahydropyridine-2,6-dicarboxylate N-acetyltransferase [Bacillus rhizoplanae]|uniref:2,3,4,5-tetrahydropyridine-2,6-dicarboxylate N-acetyltransferase n=1 Tax=Bacillus rhizoplanae TaxID=2880966 RepID=A0ABN7ZZB8_9BACI|nr:acyltransferase [Bacillus rhizoplanae]CAG9612136.1 2,3,4,5-tetrahydropyridine-2,6-dicarboxylate N-acetyltransferase [Bacillus rhizoplanae]
MSFFKKVVRFISFKTKMKYNDLKTRKYKKTLNANDKNLHIYGLPLVIKNSENIKVGKNCRFNEHVFLHGGGGITIEDNVTLSAYSKVISWTYDTSDWTSNYIKKDHVGSPIHIGMGTWVGAGATILPGVQITGKGVIVAAGSVVTKDVNDDFVLVGGSPARVLKKYK